MSLVHNGHASQVWKATNDDTQEVFAVKTLSDQTERSREMVGYLKWEYAVGSKLEHDQVIRTIEQGTDRGIPYLAMEWFPAPNMKLLIRQGLQKVEHLLPQIILQATEGLAYFNRQGLIHRDIKPENFLVADNGAVKLIDFALAQRKRGLLGRLFDRRAAVQGTRSYMSPEQIRRHALDDRTDLYSLACTLYELIAGKPPYTGASTNDLLMKHLKAPPPALDTEDPNVTRDFADLIRRAMSKDRAARPTSTAAFLMELRRTQVFRRPADPPRQQLRPGN